MEASVRQEYKALLGQQASSSLVDQLGISRARIAGEQDKESLLVAELLSRGEKSYEGTLFDATVVGKHERSSIDWELVANVLAERFGLSEKVFTEAFNSVKDTVSVSPSVRTASRK